MSRVGVVVIGRNEGERLRRCLASVVGRVGEMVYVDSGSTDGSVELARSMGAAVVELDMSRPFAAARARNEGFAWLSERNPDLEFVQFVDGDCEVREGWIEAAVEYLERNEKVAVVYGRRRERFIEASVWNRLCDIEWRGRPGPSRACGGNAMMRARVFKEVGGFNPSVIAGEEPELSLRIRRLGWEIVRLDREMTWHDSGMTRARQWWRRAVRSGHAYAQGMAMHGRGPERHYVRESLAIWAWGVGPLLLAAALAWPTRGLSALVLGVYPAQAVRTALRRKHPEDAPGDAWLYGVACTVAKWPQVVGQATYWWRALRGRAPRIIEYKGPEVEEVAGAGEGGIAAARRVEG